MLTVGVDLAAEPKNTAVAWLDWSATGATMRDLKVGADDEAVLDAIKAADKAGIDCPLGWPDQFVSFITAHQTGHVTVPADTAGRDWRRTLALRHTDLAVQLAVPGALPLSVSADKIGHVAMRCAGLLAQLARAGQPVDRSGGGVVVEVYPAASLRAWALTSSKLKGPQNLDNLAALVEQLLGAAPWLDLGPYADGCKQSDHALDAVIAALTARAAALGRTMAPAEDQIASAATEGWIAVPTSPLESLASW